MKKTIALVLLLCLLLVGCTSPIEFSEYEDEINELEEDKVKLEDEVDALEDEIKQLKAKINEYESVPTPEPTPDPTPTPKPTPEPTPEPEYYQIGDTIIFDDLEITFLSVSVQDVENRFAGFEYAAVIDVTIKNVSDEIHSLDSYYLTMFGSKGTEVENAGYYFDNGFNGAGDMRPEAVQEVCIAFEYDADGVYYLLFNNRDEEYELQLNVVKEES